MVDVKSHLKSRHFNLDLHQAFINETERLATFPLWDLNGRLVGYQRYRPDADKTRKNDPREGRYFTRRPKDKLAVWGLESWVLSNTLFVTEGIFDACRLTKKGISAIACLTSTPNSDVKNWFFCIRQTRPVVAICDPGEAGMLLAKLGHVHHVMTETDLGDASEAEVNKIMEKHFLLF